MKRQTVSLCLIAKNEEASIGMAIKSVLALVDEVIVIDTGSSDNTRIIAEGYGARVVDLPWADDFSEARNAALDEATCNWILVLDANEFLQPVRPVEFQRLLHNPGVAGYRLKIHQNSLQGQGKAPSSLRLFRRQEGVRYAYPVYEQLEPSMLAWADPLGLVITSCDLVVLSESESQDGQSGHRERNLRILRKALEAQPKEPYYPYKLACEGLTELDGEVLPVAGLNRSLGYLNQAWRLVSQLPREHARTLGWLPDLGIKVASGLLALNRPGEAQPVLEQLSTIFPENRGIRLHRAAVAIQILAKLSADPVLRREMAAGIVDELEALQVEGSSEDCPQDQKRMCNLYTLRYLGELALLEGRVSDAVGHFEQALSLDPEFSFAWLGMAECSRFAGDRKRALKLYLRTVTESQWNYRAWLRGCDLMLEMDFKDNAGSWWHRTVATFPEHPEVMAALAGGNSQEPALQLNG